MSLARLVAVLTDARFAGLPDDAIAALLNDREARRLGFAWVSADDIADAPPTQTLSIALPTPADATLADIRIRVYATRA